MTLTVYFLNSTPHRVISTCELPQTSIFLPPASIALLSHSFILHPSSSHKLIDIHNEYDPLCSTVDVIRLSPVPTWDQRSISTTISYWSLSVSLSPIAILHWHTASFRVQIDSSSPCSYLSSSSGANLPSIWEGISHIRLPGSSHFMQDIFPFPMTWVHFCYTCSIEILTIGLFRSSFFHFYRLLDFSENFTGFVGLRNVLHDRK